MDDVLPSTEVWSIDKHRARFHCGSFDGIVDVSNPESGFNSLTISTSPLSGHILAVRPSSKEAAETKPTEHRTRDTADLRVADSYVRGCDLVATYEPREAWPYTTQIYWSAPAHESADQLLGSMSLFVSLQTHLLDTWPRLRIDSLLDTDEALFLTDAPGGGGDAKSIGRGQHVLRPTGTACCVLQRLVGVPVSYAEIMPTSDFRELTIRHISDGACQTSWELFADFLEKGVIRRARMQSAFLPRENDTAIAATLCRVILGRQLPLTT
jgi:hypothetical protein